MPVVRDREQAIPPSGPLGSSVCGLEAVYRQHSAFVWRNARRLGCDGESAYDVVHEVFLVVGQKLDGFQQRSDIRTWLFGITYRVVQRHRRDHARYQKRLHAYAIENGRQLASGPHAQSAASEYLRHLLGQLDECKRAVFVLSELEGMTATEISESLGIRLGTVNSRLRAARAQLMRLLRRDSARERSSVG